jgi:hypothetical protein
LLPDVIFYKGKCLEEKGDNLKALETYQSYLKIGKKDSLLEEAQVSIIDISFNLFEAGNNSYLNNLLYFLNSKTDKILKYYAAFKLSYSKNKRVAVSAVPTLKEIMQNERDAELKDRAKIAILRIDPDLLKSSELYPGSNDLILKIQVTDKLKGKIISDITVPFFLADLVINSLPESEKQEFLSKVGDWQNLVEKIKKSKKEIITIKDEDLIIKMWVEK